MKTSLCNLLICVFLILPTFMQAAFSNGTLTEESEIYSKGNENCDGPGSDPYRNFFFSGRCNCKQNVRGKYCTKCKKNAFDLSRNHRDGCLSCYCSGRSNVCDSSNWVREELNLFFDNNSQGVELVTSNLDVVEPNPEADVIQRGIFVDNLPSESNVSYFWKLPDTFLGDKLTSYGGFISVSVNYEIHTTPDKEKKWLKDPLIIMHGNDITLHYQFKKYHKKMTTHMLPLYEQSWVKIKNKPTKGKKKDVENKKSGRKRKRAKRKDFMKVLSNVQNILIKANYKANTKKVSLLQISMSHALPNGTHNARATSVEKCLCPKGYGGLSCQYCASGYTKYSDISDFDAKSSQFKCFPCQCNGRSPTCHQETGKCLECHPNTAGDRCERNLLHCDNRGTFRTESNPPRCICKARVLGEECNDCKAGHFHLNSENEYGCKKCWCNGVTFKCSSSSLQRFQLRIQPPTFINIGFYDRGTKRLWANKVTDGRAVFYMKNYEGFSKYHWSLPKKFTGNLLKSYGGNLNFSVYNSGTCYEKIIMYPFVELESFSGEILQWTFKPPMLMNTLVTFSIKLIEDHFMFYGMSAERYTFLSILSSLKSLRIYVPDCPYLKSTEIGNIVLDTAVSWATNKPMALEVEECQCPEEYSGLSCENCSPGFVKDIITKRCVRKNSSSGK